MCWPASCWYFEHSFFSHCSLLLLIWMHYKLKVDHSIVESFAQGGRTCITSRVYPTRAIYDSARVFLFNNATHAHVKAKSVKIWQLNSAYIRPYPATTTSL
jgi:sucrose-6-phosphate hydrolase SacC (GH32 family)